MSNSVAFEKLSNMAKTKQKEIKEKEKENKDKKRQGIFDKLNRLFPTYEDIKAHAQYGKNKFVVIELKYKYDGIGGVKLPFLLCQKNCDDSYQINVMIRDYRLISYNEVYNYMKKKSIPELGKPKCRKPGIFDRGFEIYYEW